MNRKKLKTFLCTLSLSALLVYPAKAATYMVAPKDSLYTISKLFNTSVSTIKKASKLSSDIIYPKQILRIPAKSYAVKKGDSLYLIAKRNGISLYTLRKINNKWNDLIYPGQNINLPNCSTSSASKSTNVGQTSTPKSNSTASKSSSSTASSGQASNSKSVIPYTSKDLDLLARLIKAEAEDQPYNAKVGVAAVVINRVKSSQFPNTISGVIYQKSDRYYQFTPVENGWINKPATDEDRKAALEALKGKDPTSGALYYFDDSTTNKWLWSKTIKARFDKMVFVY